MPLRPALIAGLFIVTGAFASPAPTRAATPDKDAYVTVDKDGHFSLNGKRIRFWSCTGGFSLHIGKERNPYADIDLIANRLKELGFNMVRYGGGRGDRGVYKKGDSSSADITDYFYYRIKELGFKVWYTSLGGGGHATSGDVDIINDSATATAWKTAMESAASRQSEDSAARGAERAGRPNVGLARAWDARLEALAIAGMKRNVDRVNQYTGMRIADDPLFAVWELSNEDAFISLMTGGEWQKLPRFFQDELLVKWHEFLKRKYGSDKGLAKAWKFLLPGESLTNRSVLLAPIRSSSAPVLISDANPAAVAALQASKQQYSREDFTRQRGADVLEFVTDLWVSHKRRLANAVKPLGKSLTKGTLLWNTGFPGSSIQCQFLHQQAGAVAHDSYIGGTHHDSTHQRYPFFSGLEELPRLAWKEPWLEHNRTPGVPFIVYETQIDNTGKYRAEFPMRIASLGSIQDWDLICWHYYGFPTNSRKEKPFVNKLDVGHSLNLHFQYDEVQLSSMKAAAAIFRGILLKPAPSPTTFVFGKKALFDPGSMEPEMSYFGLLDRMMATTYRYGSRLVIDTTLETHPANPLFKTPEDYRQFMDVGYLILGPSYRPRTFEPNPIRPNAQIEYNWQKGHLKFDAPGVAGYTGFFAQYGGPVTFRNGVVLKDVSVVNPSGMPYPVKDDERFIEFTLASGDGKPLENCSKAVVSLVSTSFNTGFKFDLKNIEEFFAPPCTPGDLPVLVARVNATVAAPAIRGMKYRFVDWNQVVIDSGVVADGVVKISADKPVFYVELTR